MRSNNSNTPHTLQVKCMGEQMLRGRIENNIIINNTMIVCV